MHAQRVVDVDLEGPEAAADRPAAPGPGRARRRLLREVAAGAVRVERDLVAEVAAQQLGDGLAEDLAGQVPQGDVDAAQHAHLAPALGVGVEHVVEVHLDGQRVLADQAQVRQARPFAGRR